MTQELEDLRARLEALRKGRGFLLPHHGALAAGAPDLHAAYLRMYEALTVRPRHLAALERETVWLAILVAVREGIGTHHIKLFLEAGGTQEAASAVIAMAGAAPMHDGLAFAQTSWSALLPEIDPTSVYAEALERLRGDVVPAATAELAMLATHAARHAPGGVAHHIRAAYRQGITEEKLVEALSYVIWPCGVNAFLEACAAWHEVLRSGEVEPSGRFRIWADFAGQGAYDPAAGTQVGGFADDAGRFD